MRPLLSARAPLRFVSTAARCGPFSSPCLSRFASPLAVGSWTLASLVVPRRPDSSLSTWPILSHVSLSTRRLRARPLHTSINHSHCDRPAAQLRLSAQPGNPFPQTTPAPKILLRSQASSVLFLLPLLAVGVYFLCEASLPHSPPASENPLHLETAPNQEAPEDYDMEQLPGRPGTLTPEQDEKLRKFWEVFFQACGVIAGDETLPPGAQTPSSVETQDKAAPGGDKSKKSRLGLFKRKKDKDTSPSPASSTADVKADDSDDKWGENKAYFETLAKHTPEEIRSTIWAMVKHDNPDALLLRFLRARKWDVQKALVMLMSTVNWRKSEMHVDDDVMFNSEEFALLNEKSDDEKVKTSGKDFLDQMRLGKSYMHGLDKAGRPICTVRVRLHKAGDQVEESLERYTVYLIETSRFMLKPPVDTACIVFDMTGFSMANMDYAPLKFMIKCFEANYPESLGVVLVHRAPWVFQGIWKVIKGWLDPVVASKVNFTNNFKDLEEFIQADRIPKELDGQEDWEYKYVEPAEGENAKLKDTATRDKLQEERDTLFRDFEKHTVDWLNEADTTKRKELQEKRAESVTKLREQYWRLDPYVRARSLYDRTGIIKEDGSIDYYPSSSPTATGSNGAETAADDVD